MSQHLLGSPPEAVERGKGTEYVGVRKTSKRRILAAGSEERLT
jgi:hypothetical protein